MWKKGKISKKKNLYIFFSTFFSFCIFSFKIDDDFLIEVKMLLSECFNLMVSKYLLE
jgi:hypothetical protein